MRINARIPTNNSTVEIFGTLDKDKVENITVKYYSNYNKGVLSMSHDQLEDFARSGKSTRPSQYNVRQNIKSYDDGGASGENTPVKFLKRENVSLESSEASRAAGPGKKFSKAYSIADRKRTDMNFNDGVAPKSDSFYSEHGRGDGSSGEKTFKEGKIKTSSYKSLDH